MHLKADKEIELELFKFESSAFAFVCFEISSLLKLEISTLLKLEISKADDSNFSSSVIGNVLWKGFKIMHNIKVR